MCRRSSSSERCSARPIGTHGRSATLIDAETWTRAIDARPRLAPILRAINERFDIPELITTATSWLAGWSGSFVQGSFTGLISLMLMFYFLFYLLRDREEIARAVEDALPLSAPEFTTRSKGRVTSTIHATVLGMAAVSVLQGILGGAMFWWLGLPAPVFWGVLMGLLAVVPFLGAFVIWAPAALVLALAGDFASVGAARGVGHDRRRPRRQRDVPHAGGATADASHDPVLHRRRRWRRASRRARHRARTGHRRCIGDLMEILRHRAVEASPHLLGGRRIVGASDEPPEKVQVRQFYVGP